MLEREPLPGTADAGLDFIQHQQPGAPVAELAHGFQVTGWCQLHTAFALDRLHQDGHDARAVILAHLVQCLEVAERHFDEVPWQLVETQAHRRAIAGGQGAEGAAMESVVHDHHQGLLDAFAPAMQPGDFQCRFVGLGPGVVEERPVHAGQPGQLARQLLLPVDAVEVGGMQQQAGLFADGRDDFRVRVADVGHRHPGHRVQVFTTGLVPQARAQALVETQGQGLVSAHQAGGGHGIRLHQGSVFLQYG
ncbi:hypothetical protein D3C76_557840 [compost metagenome]